MKSYLFFLLISFTNIVFCTLPRSQRPANLGLQRPAVPQKKAKPVKTQLSKPKGATPAKPPPNQLRFGGNLQSDQQRVAWVAYIYNVFKMANYFRGFWLIQNVVNTMSAPTDNQALSEFTTLKTKINAVITKIGPLIERKQIADQFTKTATMKLLTDGFTTTVSMIKGRNAGGNEDLLSLTLALSLIKFEAHHNFPQVPLWENYWRLGLMQKIKIMEFVRKAQSGELGSVPPVPKAWPVKGRLMVIKREDYRSIMSVPEVASDPADIELLHGYDSIMKNDYCGAVKHWKSAANIATEPKVKKAILKKIQKLSPKCTANELSTTFQTYCQVDSSHEFPISSIVYKEKNGKEIEKAERLFWTAVGSADCDVAAEQVASLKTQLLPELLKKSPIIASRIVYMEKSLTDCAPRRNFTFQSGLGVEVLKSLKSGADDVALGIARSSGEKHLELAALIHKYPKAIYSPCRGGSMVTGNIDDDLNLLNLVNKIKNNETLPACDPSDNKCKYNVVNAAYIAGKPDLVRSAAKSIPPCDPHCKPTVQVLACTEICMAPKNPAMACQAAEHLSKLDQSQPNLKIASFLAQNFVNKTAAVAQMTVNKTITTMFKNVVSEVKRLDPPKPIPPPTPKFIPSSPIPVIKAEEIPLPPSIPKLPPMGPCNKPSTPCTNGSAPGQPGQNVQSVPQPQVPCGQGQAPVIIQNQPGMPCAAMSTPIVMQAQSQAPCGQVMGQNPNNGTVPSSACPCSAATPAPIQLIQVPCASQAAPAPIVVASVRSQSTCNQSSPKDAGSPSSVPKTPLEAQKRLIEQQKAIQKQQIQQVKRQCEERTRQLKDEVFKMVKQREMECQDSITKIATGTSIPQQRLDDNPMVQNFAVNPAAMPMGYPSQGTPYYGQQPSANAMVPPSANYFAGYPPQLPTAQNTPQITAAYYQNGMVPVAQ